METGDEMLRRLTIMTTGLLLAGALVGTASPAWAGAAPTAGRGPAVVRVSAPSGVHPLSYTLNCFGYIGTFKSGSRVMLVDWTANGSVDECFGIAPNRTIWHAWPNHRWIEMPNNGLADDTDVAFLDGAGHHVVSVWVANPFSFWCSTLTSGWQRWVRCG